MAKSVSLERVVQAYPPPIYSKMLKGYVNITGKSRSAAVSEMIENFFESLPEQDKKKYLEASKNSY